MLAEALLAGADEFGDNIILSINIIFANLPQLLKRLDFFFDSDRVFLQDIYISFKPFE